MANENENRSLYEVIHLAKTKRIEAFRLQGFDDVFWYDFDKKVFCHKSNIKTTHVEEIKNLLSYITSTLQMNRWYIWNEPVGFRGYKVVDNIRITSPTFDYYATTA